MPITKIGVALSLLIAVAVISSGKRGVSVGVSVGLGVLVRVGQGVAVASSVGKRVAVLVRLVAVAAGVVEPAGVPALVAVRGSVGVKVLLGV